MAGETSATYFTANAVTDKTSSDVFLPELWSDEVIASYKTNLKMVPLCKSMPVTGQKVKQLHIPKPERGTASKKAEATAVTIQASLDTELLVNIDRHFEYSKLIEDIVDVQAKDSLRQHYTDDAGYQLAKQMDDDLFACFTGVGDGTRVELEDLAGDGTDWVNSNVFYNNGGSALAPYAVDTVVAADVFDDVAFRALIQKMDENDVPLDNRAFVIPPTLRNAIMGVERYVSSDFRDERTVKSGLIGSVYGIDIYVSNNCPVLETAASNSASTLDTVGAFLFHKDTVVMCEQMSVRSQQQYKQEYLATLYTADTLYGIETYRPESGFVLAVPKN